MWCFWQTLVFAQAPKASHVALQSNFVDNLRGFRSQNKLKKVHIGGIWRGTAPGWLKTAGGLEKKWKLMVIQETHKQLKWYVVEISNGLVVVLVSNHFLPSPGCLAHHCWTVEWGSDQGGFCGRPNVDDWMSNAHVFFWLDTWHE